VTLNNDVPIHIVKEMLGHQSVKQTEEYAITEQQIIGRQMKELRNRLLKKESNDTETSLAALERFENEIRQMRQYLIQQKAF
jgi:guanylate kinase